MYNAEHFLVKTIVPTEVSFSEDFIGEVDTLMRFSCFPKPSFLKIFLKAHETARELNTPIQIIHDPFDNSVCGFSLPQYKTGAVLDSEFNSLQRNYFSASSPVLSKKANQIYKDAQQIYTLARAVHDKQEEIYISNMDFGLANLLCDALINRLLANHKENSEKKGKILNRFFGAATINGNVCYLPELTENISKRYFIKGRPGTGKSTFLKKIAETAAENGCDVNVYHCSFDPKSLDMVVIPKWDVCIFDSTAPHEYFPSRPTDEILDLYRECVTPGTDEKYHAELATLDTEYRAALANGLTMLKKLKTITDEAESQIPALSEEALQAETEHALQILFPN